MQAAEELEPLLASPGERETSLPWDLPRNGPLNQTPLPWWEQPPFSPSARAASDENPRASATAPEAAVPDSFFSILSALAAPADERAAPDAEISAPSLRPSAANSEPVLDAAQEEAEELSYESALRRGAQSFAAHHQAASRAPGAEAENLWPGDAETFPEHVEPQAGAGRDKRLASVTLRLSRAECALLKQRAAEAGLTVSAYIRSCTLEAETLRAQVKQAVQLLRGELAAEPREDPQGGSQTGTHASIPGKKEPVSQTLPFSHLASDPRRHWWQMRPQSRSISARA